MKIFRTESPFNTIVTGFTVNIVADALKAITGNEILMAVVKLIGWYFIITGAFQIKRHGFRCPFKGIYRLLFFSYLFVCMIMIVRGYLIDYNYQWISLQGFINFHLFSPYYILPYLMPLTVFIPYKLFRLDAFAFYSYIVGLMGIAICVINYNDVVRSSMMLAVGTGGEYMYGASYAYIYTPMAFAILCKKYIPYKIWTVNCLALFLSLLLLLISARRGGAATLSCLYLFNIYFYLKSLTGGRKALGFVMVAVGLIIAVGYFSNSSTLDFLRERGLEDTRSGVDEALLSQMNSTELVFGKGLNGRYYYPLSLDDYLDGWRYGSETGFYNIVLKGGYTMAFLYIILLVYPALLGIFKSKNLLCKAGGAFITLSVIKLYPFGWLSFNMEFLIIWMLVSLCYSKKVRQMTDKEIHSYLFVTDGRV